MKHFLFLLLFGFSIQSFSQVSFAKRYFENATLASACEAADEGMLVSYSRHFDTCACSVNYVMLCNKNGDSLWTKKTDTQPYIYKDLGEDYFAAEIDNFWKLDSAFNPVWNFHILMLWDNIYDVSQAPDSGYFLLGLKDTVNFGNPSINHLYKLDKNGNQLWEKYYHGNYHMIKIASTPDNGAIIYSNFPDSTGTYFLGLVKVNSNGDSVWGKIYTDLRLAGLFKPIVSFPNGEIGFVAHGNTYSSLLIKTNELGNILYRDSVSGNSTIFINLNAGIGGSMLAIGTNNTQPDQDIQLLIREYNPVRIINQPIGDLSNEEGLYIYQTSDSGSYMVAQRDSGVKKEILLLHSSPGHNFYYSVPGINANDNIIVYPNPCSSSFQIESLTGSRQIHLDIFNTLGEKVYSTSFAGEKETIIHHLNAGIYFAVINDEEKQITRKLIVE